MSNELEKPSKYSNAQLAIIRGVGQCALHFRIELTDADLEIFKHALRNTDALRIEAAFDRCLNECEFMPKLADVWAKMPEAEPSQEGIEFGVDAQEWTEQYEGRTIRYKGDPKGTRVITG